MTSKKKGKTGQKWKWMNNKTVRINHRRKGLSFSVHRLPIMILDRKRRKQNKTKRKEWKRNIEERKEENKYKKKETVLGWFFHADFLLGFWLLSSTISNSVYSDNYFHFLVFKLRQDVSSLPGSFIQKMPDGNWRMFIAFQIQLLFRQI